MMMKIDFATPEEIKYAESILLPQGKTFEDDKVKIIQCNESKSIKACPGSGKTTTLLAKLAILANRMPLEKNQGICVLTHTNVAIDEIKSKLGHKSDILFSYPNHFGTIQSFVDKFLAIPNYEKIYDKKLNEISNDAYLKALDRNFRFEIGKLKRNEFSKRIWHFILNNIVDGTDPSSFLHSIRLDIINDEIEIINRQGRIIKFEKPRRKKQKKYTNWSDTEIKEIKDWFIQIIQNSHSRYGVISYTDAYLYAKDYLCSYPHLVDAFSSRFRYIFLDEMQDTDIYQLQIIEQVFDNQKTIIQYFGDPHQAIFYKAKANVVWQPVKHLPINASKRFGEKIAKILRSVCIEANLDLEANPEINSLKPHLIVYDEPKDVLPKFCELVSSAIVEKDGDEKTILKLSIEEKKTIKAVGWVGEPNKVDKLKSELTIQSYFPSFRKNIKKKEKVDYDSIKTFLRKQEKATVKDYSDNIIRALVHILSTENKKPKSSATNRNYSKSTLLSELKDTNLKRYSYLLRKLAIWSKDIHLSDGYSDEAVVAIKKFIIDHFLIWFDIKEPNRYTNDFLQNEPKDNISEEDIKLNNTYKCDKNEQVKIEIGTIHSVKGETHVATLLLETWYEGNHESEIIIDQILGIPYVKARSKDVHKKETLKMSYVAMSRPKYLLCMAIKKDRIQGILDDANKRGLLENLWNIELI
jgi:hypothetical protein